MPGDERLVVVMPARNCARTLATVYGALPHDLLDSVIVVDDASEDDSASIARQLGAPLFVHKRKCGYGANQKTCYRAALNAGASIIVMLHPDGQHDASRIPDLVQPILNGCADMVLGSRFMGASPVTQGMPRWKYVGNRILTYMENVIFGLQLTEYHTGFRAFRREVLATIPFWLNSDNFAFDQEIIAQTHARGFRIAEIPISTIYLPESSSATLFQSLRYGIGVAWMLVRYGAHRSGLHRQPWLVPQNMDSEDLRRGAIPPWPAVLPSNAPGERGISGHALPEQVPISACRHPRPPAVDASHCK